MSTKVPPNTPLRVSVSEHGIISIHGNVVGLKQLPKRLKEMGATANTNIIITFQESASSTMMKDVRDQLIFAHLPKIIIAQHKKPEAYVK